jgi:hypothetical protein
VFGPYRAALLWGLGVGLAYSTMVSYSLYYILGIWVLLAGEPFVGAGLFALYGLSQGLLLTGDVIAARTSPRRVGGLLGLDRSRQFYSLSGSALLLCALYLVALCAGPIGWRGR